MKKIIFALVATLACAGCSKDKNGNDNQMLIGRWECAEITVLEEGDWAGSTYFTSAVGCVWMFDNDTMMEFDDAGTTDYKWGSSYSYDNNTKKLSCVMPLDIKMEQLSSTEFVIYLEGWKGYDEDFNVHTTKYRAVFQKIK